MSAETMQSSLERFHDELIRYQRQVMLGSVTGMVVHELNNLMMPVLMRAQDALSRNDATAMRKALECTVRQTERAVAIGRRLLELAEGESLEPLDYSVADAVEGALTAIPRPLAKDGIELSLAVPADLRVRAEPVLFEQVLVNLLLNARQAMSAGHGSLSIQAHRTNESIELEIRDSGCGIDAQRLESVIRPFLASDAADSPCAWQEVGLGLTTCRAIAHRHGAAIDAFSNDGGGCVFRITWPAA